jgi:hypothetical protein
MIAPPANLPFSFLWTPVNGATKYELQLSDRFDVRSHLLVDVTVPGTAYAFTNLNIPGSGFTVFQPNGVPLSGGPYHWRVRAIAGGTATIFSPIANFTLGTTPGGTPIHDLAVATIGTADNPTMGVPSAVLVRVENRGSFAATGANVLVTVNGQTIGTEQIKPLAPGDADNITLPWSPSQPGITSIVATLDYADDVPAHKTSTYSFSVQPQKMVAGSFLGVIGGTCGSYILKDEQGNTIAQLQPGVSSATLQSLYDQKTAVTGNLSIGPQGPQIAVQSAARAGAGNTKARNPCAELQTATIRTSALGTRGATGPNTKSATTPELYLTNELVRSNVTPSAGPNTRTATTPQLYLIGPSQPRHPHKPR